MSLRCDLRRRAPSLHPLALSLLLVLGVAPGAALARDLDGEHEEVTAADPVEDWRLFDGASLRVTGGNTLNIFANSDSTVDLQGATVTRAPGSANEVIALWNRSSLIARDSTLLGGTLYLTGSSQATLINSELRLVTPANGFNGAYIGIDLDIFRGDDSRLTLEGSTVVVADRPNNPGDTSGIGIRMAEGEVIVRGGSLVDAANVGVAILGTGEPDVPRILRVDNSVIRTGRGAAIDVDLSAMRAAPVHIFISNGAKLEGGNGEALRVMSNNDGPKQVLFEVDDARIQGDLIKIIPGNQGRLDALLTNNARIEGRFIQVTSAAIQSNSTWALNGNSTVGHLDLKDTGTVLLGNGADDGIFNTLTLDRFTGSGGTLVFNTVLADDSAQTDKVVINGDADGHAGVVVRNAGGQGAQTDQGIALITIDGSSNAEFDLIGRATGGLYDYFLFKGDDGNWYLRSELPTEPPHECVTDPSLPQCEVTLPVEPIDPEHPDPENPDPEQPEPEQPDPEEPGKPQPVLRPETGAYLANQAAMGQLLQHSAQTRMGHAGADDGLRTWALTELAESRQALTGQQTLEATRQRLQVGADIGVFDGGQGRVGAMLSAGKAEATARSTVTGYRADGTVEGGSVGAYAHWSNDALYLDASVQHGRFRNTVHGEGLQAERYDSRAWQSAIEAGYRFNVGRVGSLVLNLQPQLQLGYTDAQTDEHRESNGTVVRSAGASGLSTRLGLRLQGDAVTGGNRFAPYVALNAYRDTRTAGMVFDGERIDGGVPRHRAELTLGGTLALGTGFSAWSDFTASQGADGFRELGARIGAAWRW